MENVAFLLNAYLDDELDDAQRDELAAWMRESAANIDQFVAECYFSSLLQDVLSEEQLAAEAANAQDDMIQRLAADFEPPAFSIPKAAAELLPMTADQAIDGSPSVGNFHATSVSPAALPTRLGSAAHDLVGYFSEGWPLAYLITTMLFVAAIAAASRIYVADYMTSPAGTVATAKHAAQQEDAAALEASLPKKRQVVAQITGLADCRWKLVGSKASGERKLPVRESKTRVKDQQGADAPRSPSVAFGDRLDVAGGLMELTYDTGAVVLLQGPCTFTVETNGGFLAVGRLTGVMEKKPVVSGQWAVDSKVGVRVGSGSETKLQIPKSQNPEIPTSSNPHSLISNPSLATSHQPLATSFTIATPTAIVTDLGTEFGVEVNRNKSTFVHVIRGEVEAHRDARSGVLPLHERLTAGQSIFVASLNDLPQRFEASNPIVRQTQRVGQPAHIVMSPDLKAAMHEVHVARKSLELLKPIGLVATAYHRVFDKNGNLLAENDRRLAFQVATDGVFDQGWGVLKPFSCFDTALVGGGQWTVGSERDERRGARGEGIENRLAPASTPGNKVSGKQQPADIAKPQTAGNAKPQAATNHTSEIVNQKSQSTTHSPLLTNLATSHQPLTTTFVGLRYAEPARFDRLRIFFARQTKEGGNWAETPRLFILKNPVDTDQTPPEQDAANWRELPLRPFWGVFSPSPEPGHGMSLEIPLTAFSVADRTGYGWALGGVPGNGSEHFIAITELRAYTTDKQGTKNKE